MSAVVLFIATAATAALLTPLARWLSFRWGVVAVPGGRRLHPGLMPKLGGLPIFGAFWVGVALTYWLRPPQGEDAQLLRGVLLGSVVAFGGGLLDDFREQPAWSQFVVQLLCTAVAVYYQTFLEVFTNPLTNGEVRIVPWFVPFITLFWVAGMMNTINWLDGLDGLAAGVGTIAALIFAWHSYNLGQTSVALIALALAAALLGFLPFNFWPARIFLGSAGPYFLGYALATLAIIAPAKIATALLVMAVPILDVAWQIIDRLRRGQSPFRGDRGHLHFRLSDGGLPTRRIVLSYYVLAAAFGLVAIFAPGVWKLMLLVGLVAAVFGLLIWLGRSQKRGADVK